jgi:hypothetical protein
MGLLQGTFSTPRRYSFENALTISQSIYTSHLFVRFGLWRKVMGIRSNDFRNFVS